MCLFRIIHRQISLEQDEGMLKRMFNILQVMQVLYHFWLDLKYFDDHTDLNTGIEPVRLSMLEKAIALATGKKKIYLSGPRGNLFSKLKKKHYVCVCV